MADRVADLRTSSPGPAPAAARPPTPATPPPGGSASGA